MQIRTYSELRSLATIEDRFRYLELPGSVGRPTFGYDRWMNQKFYHSREWRSIRDAVILRDNGCDLGVEGYEIAASPIIHHMNPIVVNELVEKSPDVIDPEYLICTWHPTHNAIHYGDERLLPKPATPRRPGDTKLW